MVGFELHYLVLAVVFINMTDFVAVMGIVVFISPNPQHLYLYLLIYS
jgi:hypothetical protein